MVSCLHQQWLRAQRDENGFVLHYSNRIGNIANSFPRPAKQYPSLIFFIGKQSKSQALQALFPENSISNCRKYGIANICAEPTTTQDDHPLLLADSSPDFAQTNLRGKTVCHETKKYQVAWPDDGSGPITEQGLANLLHARLLSLFIDVLCIFAADCGGLDGVAEKLASWATLGSASSLPISSRPRLLVVINVPGHLFVSEALRFRLRVVAHPKFAESFSSLNLVNLLGSNRRRPRAQFGSLREVIYQEISMARLERVNTHTLFSMMHVASLFEMALKSFAAIPWQEFDFISSSRGDNPVSYNFGNHLKSFLSLSLAHNLPDNILWDFVGSAIILDAFPTDMHCKQLVDSK